MIRLFDRGLRTRRQPFITPVRSIFNFLKKTTQAVDSQIDAKEE